MNIELSPAQIGCIVSAVNSLYGSDSEEANSISKPLCECVLEFLGFDFYKMWCSEFDISEV